MYFGRNTRTVITLIASVCFVIQTTPIQAAPPVKAKTVTSTTAKRPAANLSGQGLKSKAAVPTTDFMAESAKKSTAGNKPITPTAIDVALNPEGKIVGRVLDAKQKGVANTPVLIRQGQQEVARTFTDAQGQFEIQQQKGGVFVVSSNNGHGLFRFWTNHSAPPAAHEEVLLMSQAVVVRAQSPDNNDQSEILYDDNGQPYAQVHVVDDGQICDENCPPVGSGGLGCLDCCCLLLVAATAAALTIAIIALDDPDPATP